MFSHQHFQAYALLSASLRFAQLYVQREIVDNAYAKFSWENKEYCGIFEKGLFKQTFKSIPDQPSDVFSYCFSVPFLIITALPFVATKFTQFPFS